MTRGLVEFHQVWKKFRRGEFHDSLRDLIPALTRGLLTRGPRRDELALNEFWALQDVSFTVQPGQALGIIGPNGAGKSTILKLLTRIIRPTAGSCAVRGRLGSLIELSAGFHPDLTGRENVFLQGAIMGMRQADIARQFDSIVALAELQEFIDTPVKRYSSGMNARLGFSIAVHLDPDVLVIDEVLAVGDHAFQKRAFERIAEMTRREIPVVIVSHQLERIASLCTDAILLDRGRVVCRGSPATCISEYITGVAMHAGHFERSSEPMGLTSIAIASNLPVASGDRLRLLLRGAVEPPGLGGRRLSLLVRSVQTGQLVFLCHYTAETLRLPARASFELEISLQANVAGGLYAIETGVWDPLKRYFTLQGPQVVVQVAETDSFFGPVNMQAAHELRVRAEPGIAPAMPPTAPRDR